MADENHMELWQYLAQQKHIDSNMTNRSFAKRVGINHATLSRIMNYKHCPAVRLAKKIAEATDHKVLWYDLLDRCSKNT
jgi:DNA-binding XRE family transcriptional regulator